LQSSAGTPAPQNRDKMIELHNVPLAFFGKKQSPFASIFACLWVEKHSGSRKLTLVSGLQGAHRQNPEATQLIRQPYRGATTERT